MKKTLTRTSVLLTLGWVLTCCAVATGQRMISLKPVRPVICRYSTVNRPDHIPPSDRFRQMIRSRGARVRTAIIDVEYVNFPADNLAKDAFQYAIAIWESELVSSVPIHIRAEWKPLGSGVLGEALWGRAYANFGGEQHINTFYPVALAEKVARRELNSPDEPDIVASFSSNASWYYGKDGQTPSGKMDLVTIVLHEIAHGLGFTDSYEVKGTEASVGLPDGELSAPFIFDLYVQNDSSKNLCYDFQAPSPELADALQSTNLFFGSPLAIAALGGSPPELFAPKTFQGGSSVSHLDEATFNDDGDPNRLMTPHIALAESIHEPGSVLRAILSDMGWVYTNIDHQALKDTERKDGQPYVVKTSVRSDNGYKPGEVKLHYSTDGEHFTVLNMTPTGAADEFESALPGATTDKSYGYFISAVDVDGRPFTNPGKLEALNKQPEQGLFVFHIGPDVSAPEISHVPVEYVFQDASELHLSAEVTDNMGISEVLVEYIVNDGPLQTVIMEETASPDQYAVTIMLPSLEIGDRIQYRLIASDLAANENATQMPSEDFFSVTVTGIKPVTDAYSNNFNLPSADFFGSNFHITTPAGFENGAIHSDHPYNNGSGPNEESNYTLQLQVPIRIGTTNPVIKFDEIVLVEPGEPSSEFGDDDFFDYVIIEGSSDGGVTWKPFADGYDSRYYTPWLTLYNSDIVNFNSRATGTPSLFHKRTINMLDGENFLEGDVVLIRFRLFADALAHGWGWAIDNLSVQGPVTDVEKGLSATFSVYPVPVTQDLVVELLKAEQGPVHIQILDVEGRMLFDEEVSGTTGDVKKTINTWFLKNGTYILKAASGDKMYTRRFFKLAP